MPVITTIKLTGEDHRAVDGVAALIKQISDDKSVQIRGPIPLPTRRLVVPTRKSPDGEGSYLEAGRWQRDRVLIAD